MPGRGAKEPTAEGCGLVECTRGGVALGGVLGTVGVSEAMVLEMVGCEASEVEVTVVVEGSSIDGSSRVGTVEGSLGGTLSDVLLMLSPVGEVSDSSDIGVGLSSALSPSGVDTSVSLLPESLEAAKVEGDEGFEGMDGVRVGDGGVTDDDGVMTVEDVDVGETDVDEVDEVGDNEGDDVDDCEDCDVKVDKDETDVVGMVVLEGGDGGGSGGGVAVVAGVMTAELCTVPSSSGEVVTTSGGRSEVVLGGRRSIGRGIPVAKGLGKTEETREASEGGRGARNGGRVLATNCGRPGTAPEGGVMGGLMGKRVGSTEESKSKGSWESLGGPRLLIRVLLKVPPPKVVRRVLGSSAAVTLTLPPRSSTMP